jgi:hypothetical protein
MNMYVAGNGRQSQVTDTHGGDHAVNDVHHDVTGMSTLKVHGSQ